MINDPNDIDKRLTYVEEIPLYYLFVFMIFEYKVQNFNFIQVIPNPKSGQTIRSLGHRTSMS